MPIVPRIGAETRSPEDPNWTYSTLVAFTLLCSEAGTGGAGIFNSEVSLNLKAGVHEVSVVSAAELFACDEAMYIYIYRQRIPPAERDRLDSRT